MEKVISATEARVHFGELIRQVAEEDKVIIVQRSGKPQVVVLSVDEYERLKKKRAGWEEALERAIQLSAQINARRGGKSLTPPEEIIHRMREERDEQLMDLRLLVKAKPGSRAVIQWKDWHKTGNSLVAPTLLYYEVSNALHRYTMAGELLPEEADAAIASALAFDISLYADDVLHTRAISLARKFSLPAVYDAHYLALAERLGAEFWTADKRLAQKVEAELDWVHLLVE